METSVDEKILRQRELTFGEISPLEVIAACKVDNGILNFDKETSEYINLYNQSSYSSSFFIPASGSGTRMFAFMHKYVNFPDQESQGQVEKLIHHIQNLAFSKRISPIVINNLKDHKITLEKFIDYLLNEDGLNLGNLPKGLIPFHRIGPFILTPFQEHLLQGIEVIPGYPKFHFTISKEFQKRIRQEQENLRNIITSEFEVTYSYQDEETDVFVFDKDQELILDAKNHPLKKPSGHGALLSNLSKINSDIIFIKNIDNIQHYNKSKPALDTFKKLGGILIAIEKDRNELLNNFSVENFVSFNHKYAVLQESQIRQLSIEKLKAVIDLPIRVCGMVKNEGEPGGGPFWVSKDGIIRKQIIEKSQIPSKYRFSNLLIDSSHFNPVMIALRNANSDGRAFDLTKLVDKEQYLKVTKIVDGREVHFYENPGLWNGSMYNWLTVFVEVPSQVFSPVKTILDLLSPIHQSE